MSTTTIDHDEIRAWAESHRARPVIVKSTRKGEGMALLQLHFGQADDRLQEISWEDFFKIFEERNLAFLYQDRTFKFIDREKM